MKKKSIDNKSFEYDESAHHPIKINLPQIILKHFHAPDKNDKSLGDPDVICAWCKEMIIIAGGGYIDEKGKQQMICDDCAVDRYMEDFGYNNFETAMLRRRRIFDVQYLLTELILDQYLEKTGKMTLDDLSEKEYETLLEFGRGLYNQEFTKRQKILLEEIFSQREIEKKFNTVLHSIDFELMIEDFKKN